MKLSIDELRRHIEDTLFTSLVMDRICKMPVVIKLLTEAGIDLNSVYSENRSILQCAISSISYRCLAYFLDLGLDPFMRDISDMRWSAAHMAAIYLSDRNIALARLMGFVFVDPQFFSLKNYLGKPPSSCLAAPVKLSIFEKIRNIFLAYVGFHNSAERAANLTPPDHLLAALYYFLAAEQMKTKVADEEDDFYLKRFHLKKVVGDLREAIAHYHQAILVEGKIPDTVSEFNACLILSEEMIRTVAPDNPERNWEIKLGDAETFRLWNEQLMLLQNWLEERRTSFSSTGSGSSAAEDDAKKVDERTALLGESAGLQFRG